MADVTARPAAQPGAWKDPYTNFRFKVSISDNVSEAAFVEVTGLEVFVERVEYRPHGGGPETVYVPGRTTYSPVTLRYGLTDSSAMWEWMLSAMEGRVQRHNVSIAVLNADGRTQALRWNLAQAWPMAWSGAPLHTLGREIAIESLTLAHQGLTRERAGADPTGSPAGATGV
jgi:phage tail-like protein